MDWKSILMHSINLAVGLVLVLKGQRDIGLMVLGATYGLAAPQALARRASDLKQNGQDALDAASKAVNKVGASIILFAGTLLLFGLGCATLKNNPDIQECAIPTVEQIATETMACVAQGNNVLTCTVQASLNALIPFTACEYQLHSKGVHHPHDPFDGHAVIMSPQVK